MTNNEINPLNSYRCKFCKLSFRTRGGLMNHIIKCPFKPMGEKYTYNKLKKELDEVRQR
jgi:hypothetical protein